VPITVRPATVADAAAVHRIYAPVVAETAVSFEEVPPTVAEMAERIAAISRTHPFLVAVNEDGVCGYVYGGPHAQRAAYRYSVGTTVYIAPQARRSGVGRALYGALLPELKRCGFHAAFAGIALPNPGSVALHEAVGFELVGIYREVGFKFGRWHDLGYWQRLL